MKIIFEKIALKFIVFLYRFLDFLLDLFRFFLFWRLKIPKHVEKIVVFRIGNIGDTICAIPAMVTIRENFPQAEIVLLSSPGKYGMPGTRELLENAEFLDRLIIYHQEDIKVLKGKFNLIKKFKKERFDLFIELPQNLSKLRTEIRNIIFAKFINVKYTFGFQIETVRLFRKIQSKYLKFNNEVERLLKIIKKEGLKINKVCFPLSVSQEDKKVVKEFLNSLGGKNLIAINPNAKRQTNLWPLDRFSKVGRWLIENNNVETIIIGGKGDKEVTDKLQGMIGKEAINIAGRFSLLQTIELLKYCQLLVSNDTGIIHMASAVGTPVIGIYSARDFKNKWFPYGGKNIVLRKEPKCHTCFKERCENLRCLTMITPKEVTQMISSILETYWNCDIDNFYSRV